MKHIITHTLMWTVVAVVAIVLFPITLGVGGAWLTMWATDRIKSRRDGVRS